MKLLEVVLFTNTRILRFVHEKETYRRRLQSGSWRPPFLKLNYHMGLFHSDSQRLRLWDLSWSMKSSCLVHRAVAVRSQRTGPTDARRRVFSYPAVADARCPSCAGAWEWWRLLAFPPPFLSKLIKPL